jgi:pSer/pThr/pTyr-binding forkhead associated (FHA) protein
MTGTRRSTPIVAAPRMAAAALAHGRSRELRAPIVVCWTTGEREHERGELVIGRAASSDVLLEDPLVSRTHARIVVTADGAVLVEDLHSANGVFVNGVRITQRSARLNEGDRLLIGMSEFSLFSGRESATLPIGERVPVDSRPPPPSVPNRVAIPIARIERSSGTMKAAPPAHASGAPTERSTALGMIGRLADSLAASGRTSEAVELVSENLKKIMLGATAGLPVPESMLHEASHLALDLFHRTGNAAWQNYVIELHLLAKRLPAARNLEVLEATLDRAGTAVDPSALGYLVESLATGFESMNSDERNRFLHLARLSRTRRGG